MIRSLLLSVAALAAAETPLTRVVTLLQDLSATLDSDQAAEQKVYDKFACWCENTTARKADTIENAKLAISEYQQELLSNKGAIATLSAEVAGHLSDIEKNEKSQEEATHMRQKQNEAFMLEKSELEQTAGALEKAIMVLSGHHSGAFLSSHAAVARSVAQAAMRAKVTGTIDAAKLKLLSTFLRGAPGASASYSPQSATIVGILREMYSSFTADLEAQNQEEGTAQASFENFMNQKAAALAALQKSLKQRQGSKAGHERALGQIQLALADTTTQLTADAKFMDATKAACTDKADSWQQRSSLYAEEREGVRMALDILDTDAARELMGRAVKPGMEQDAGASFLQRGSAKSKAAHAAKSKALAALARAAKEAHSPRLAALATGLRDAGHFDAVLLQIDQLVKLLDLEQAADLAHRDGCIDTRHAKNSSVAAHSHQMKRENAAVEKLDAEATRLTGVLADTRAQIVEVTQALLDIQAARDGEHQTYQTAKKDDEDAIALLSEATTHLKAYFENNNIDLGKLQLLQDPDNLARHDDHAPDAELSGSDSHGQQSKGVISILTMLTQDLENEIKSANRAEAASHTAHTKQKAALVDLQTSLRAKEGNTEVAKASAESERDAAQERHDDELDLKTGLEDELRAIKKSCDFITKHYDERQDKRTSERDGLTEAKGLLSGAQLSLVAESKDVRESRAFLASNFGGLA